MSKSQKNLSLVGGALAGLGAAACCAGPLILMLLGISGSWIANLAALEPYRPLFIVLSIGLLGLAYRNIFRPSADKACQTGRVCATSAGQQFYKVLFWIVAVLIVLSILSPYLLAYLFG